MQRSDIEQLALTSDDCGNWTWPDESQAQWRNVTDSHQTFYSNWRSHPFKYANEFPYRLSYGMRQPDDAVGSEIIVTEAYEAMYYRILKFRYDPRGRGVVLTGQPGIGKTTFLRYLLVRLISAHQAVVYFNGVSLRLYYAGKAYFRVATDFYDLPIRDNDKPRSIWLLIDMDSKLEEPLLVTDTSVWPIQASSPKPIRWNGWSKQFHAAKWGMPFWTFDELMLGLRIQSAYADFRKNLEMGLDLQSNGHHTEAVDAALEILKRESQNKVQNVVADSMDVDAGASENLGTHDTVDDAIKVLVRDAIAEYGNAPRVVYQTIFCPAETKKEHQDAIKTLDYAKLVRDFSDTRELGSDTSHHLIAVSPIKYSETNLLDGWKIDFKSFNISRQAMAKMQKAQDQRLRTMYAFYNKTPGASGLAGCVFEALTHRMISDGSWSDIEPRGIPMHSDNKDTPTFSADSPPLQRNSPPFRSGPMEAKSVDLIRHLDDLIFNSNTYYIANSPLFDSFIVTVDNAKSTAVISAFQITISRTHRGSNQGYLLIRKLRGRVLNLHPGFTVTIAYWLVCPSEDEFSKWIWQMPDDWNKYTTEQDHRGDAFCLRIPIRIIKPTIAE